MNQITLRQIPDLVLKQLRLIAQKHQTSINKTIIAILKQSLGMENNPEKMRDLSDLAGGWDERELEEFVQNTEIFEHIDHEVWKS